MKKSIVVLSLFVCTMYADHQQNQIENPMPNQKHKVVQLEPIIIHGHNSPNRYALDLNSTNDVYPELVLKNKDGNPIGINYVALVPILIQQVQMLHKKIQELEEQQ